MSTVGFLKDIKSITNSLAGRSARAANAGGILPTIRESMFSGVHDMVGNAIQQSKHGDIDWWKAAKKGFMEGAGDDAKIRWGRVAGTASALSIGWRFASGGGIYRDKNGNFDVAGVPFI